MRNGVEETAQNYWTVLGAKFSQKFAPEFLPKHLFLMAQQSKYKNDVGLHRIKSQYKRAEELIVQAIDLEKKKKIPTKLLVDCCEEYGTILSEIESRKGEAKSNQCYRMVQRSLKKQKRL